VFESFNRVNLLHAALAIMHLFAIGGQFVEQFAFQVFCFINHLFAQSFIVVLHLTNNMIMIITRKLQAIEGFSKLRVQQNEKLGIRMQF